MSGAAKEPSASLTSPAGPQGESYQEDSELSELPLLERGKHLKKKPSPHSCLHDLFFLSFFLNQTMNFLWAGSCPAYLRTFFSAL